MALGVVCTRGRGWLRVGDGGSGVAVLLEIARQLQAHPADIGVDLLLFDAEDQGSDDLIGAAIVELDHAPENDWTMGSCTSSSAGGLLLIVGLPLHSGGRPTDGGL